MSASVITDGVLRERWDDVSRTYTTWNAAGVQTSQRAYTVAENAAADAEIAARSAVATSVSLRIALADGVAQIQAARKTAMDDIAVATSLRTSANTLKTEASNQRVSVNAFVPAATYTAIQIGQIRDAVKDVIARQEQVLQALSDFYGYRIAVDNNAVTTDDALLGLARIIADRLP